MGRRSKFMKKSNLAVAGQGSMRSWAACTHPGVSRLFLSEYCVRYGGDVQNGLEKACIQVHYGGGSISA